MSKVTSVQDTFHLQTTLFDLMLSDTQRDAYFHDLLSSLDVTPQHGWPDRFGVAMRRWLAQRHSSIKTLSLFSGGGGLDIGFHDSGFHVSEMVEIEAKYAHSLSANAGPDGYFNGATVTCADIRTYQPACNMEADFLIGGPPCQTFSAAGRRAAGVQGTSDPRGILFQEYVRLIRTLRPKGFLFENVYGITGAQEGEAWAEIQTAFRDAGYSLFSRILDAADYGVPQHRERLFIVGLREGSFLFPCPTHGPDAPDRYPFYTAAEAIAGLHNDEGLDGIGGRFGSLLKDIPPGLNYSFYTKEMGHPRPIFSWRSKFSDYLYKADPEMPVRTLKAQVGAYSGPFHWENRPFTIAEHKRLQTFPDAYKLSGGRQICIQQIGNSVPPQLGRMLALSILNQVFGVDLPFSLRYLSPDMQLGFRQRKRQLTERYAAKAMVALRSYSADPETIEQAAPSAKPQAEEVRFLGTNFSWKKTATAAATRVRLLKTLTANCWHIKCNGEFEAAQEHSYSISIRPSSGDDWPLGQSEVHLECIGWEPLLFTGLWKAFEETLCQSYGVADLVQLFGYYQYPAKARAALSFREAPSLIPLWSMLPKIVQGVGVASQYTASELAMLWHTEEETILPLLKEMRLLGYEVRSHNTNPQIKEGIYLIPYLFPTLTPKSIQLRKQI